MRRLLPLSILLLAASCGSPDEQGAREDMASYDVAENATEATEEMAADSPESSRAPSAGPNVSVPVAPGVEVSPETTSAEPS